MKKLSPTTILVFNIIVLLFFATNKAVDSRNIDTQPQQLLNKVHVILINNITGDLGVQCKSGNDDLSEIRLPYQANYEFSFHPSLLGNTWFFCRFQAGSDFRHFDVYVESRDKDRCMTCRWLLGSNGPCLFNPNTALFDICSNWNP